MLSGRLGGCSRRSLFAVFAGSGRNSRGCGVRTVQVVSFVSTTTARVSISSVSTAAGSSFVVPTTRRHNQRPKINNSKKYGAYTLNHYQQQQQQQQVRLFHATQPREILPIVGVAVVLMLGRYSYKALQRMDDEWEEYQWALQRYDKQQQQQQQQKHAQNHQFTLAIDLGSVYTKLATSHPQLDVMVSREGDRAFFTGVAYETSDDTTTSSSTNPPTRGRTALEQFYYRPLAKSSSEANEQDSLARDEIDEEQQRVQVPWLLMTTHLNHKNRSNIEQQVTRVVSDSLTPVLEEALDRLDDDVNDEEKKNNNNNSATHTKRRTRRKVVTIPMAHEPLHVLPAIMNSVLRQRPDPDDDDDEEEPPVLLPEPVAAVWGAQVKGLLPTDLDDKTTLVVDVGGFTTQVSLVQRDRLLHALAIPFGGETLVRLAVDLLVQEAESNHPSTPLTDARSLSAIQLQARAAVTELTKHTRVQVHVPYLFPDPQQHHLDTSLSRIVLEQALQQYIRERLTPRLSLHDTDEERVLSPHVPPPTDLSSLLLSVLTQVLEYGNQTPQSIQHILLVGGGSKPPFLSVALRQALMLLMGSEGEKKVILPDSSVKSELTVLGAASMLPGYDYSIDRGLQRRDAM